LFLSEFTWSSVGEKTLIQSSMKIHENPSNKSRVVSCGWTDRETDIHDEANNRFYHFANAVKNNET